MTGQVRFTTSMQTSAFPLTKIDIGVKKQTFYIYFGQGEKSSLQVSAASYF